MKLLLAAIAVFVAINKCVNGCGGGGGGGGGVGWEDGPKYTFRNGVYVKVTGPIDSPTGWVGYSTRFRRQIDNTTTQIDKGEEKENCRVCIKIYAFLKDFGGRIANIEKQTKADVVLKAQLKGNNIVKSISHISMAFDVIDVYKTSDKSIEPDETLSIDADTAHCQCLPTLTDGDYIITGKVKKDGKLHLNGDLYKI